MRMDEQPTPDTSIALPFGMMLEADRQAISLLVGAVSSLIEHHRASASEGPLFRIADLNIGDGSVSACVVDVLRQRCGKGAHVRVSGTEIDVAALEKAREALGSRNALGVLDIQDASSSPAKTLRNKLECVGGADMVLYAHAAYPGRLPSFKLPRMVDRLGDMVAPHGAVVTLHNHGPSDMDDIRWYVLGQRAVPVAGVNCDTQHRLERAFSVVKLHSFSVTVPNMVALPANMQVVEAIFSSGESSLHGKHADDGEIIRSALEKLAGGKEKFDKSIQSMSNEARQRAVNFFAGRIQQAGGKDMPITVGGGQMVMAFRSQELAQEAFRAVNAACQDMAPPAIALPISSGIMPEFDKHGTHKQWKGKLAERGILNPPRVCQTELDIADKEADSVNAREPGRLHPAAAHRWQPEHRPTGS